MLNTKQAIKAELKVIAYSIKPWANIMSRVILIAMPFTGMMWSPNNLILKWCLPVIILLVYLGLCLLSRQEDETTCNIPTEHKRFTHRNYTDGEVSMDQNRIHEAILYIADCEDYFERGGK